MQLRKLLLRVMLGSLAAAAVIGVLAMLFFRETIIVRVIGTAVMTAVAAALLMALSLMADREKSRSAGIFGMAVVVGEYLLGLLMIWGIDTFWNSRWFDVAGIVMLTIAGIALPGMFYLRMLSIPQGRLSARVGIGLCAVVFLLFAIPPLLSNVWYDTGNWYGTAFCLATFGALATGSVAGAGFDRRHWRYFGVLAAVVGTVMGTIAIWHPMNRGEFAFAIVASIAAVIAHANLALLCPLKPGQRWLAYATIGSSLLTAICIDLVILTAQETDGLLPRLAGAAGILAGCGSLAMLVLAGLNRKFRPRTTLSQIERYTLICPGCSRKQTLPIGDTSCPTCNLEIHVTFTEPHCPQCGYLLYMLASDRCPECGTFIRKPASPAAPPALNGLSLPAAMPQP